MSTAPKKAKHEIVARISIKRPGAMTLAERRLIATWLRKQAINLVLDGAKYVDKSTFHATRYE